MTTPPVPKTAPRPAPRRPAGEAERRAVLIARVERAARQRRRARMLTRRTG